MSADLTLDEKQLSRALDVVVAHQSTLKRYFFRYRWMKATFYLAIFVFGGIPFLEGFAEGLVEEPGGVELEDIQPYIDRSKQIATYLGGALFFTLVPLFFINLPFALQLFRQERMRRRLGVQDDLRETVKSTGKTRYIMTIAALAGIGAAVTGVYRLITEVSARNDLVELFTLISIIIIGLSIPLLWLLSRGVDRLQEVSGLRDRLSSSFDGSESPGAPVDVTLSNYEYDRIAQLEKRTIQSARERSVEKGVEFAKNSVYAVQRSHQSQAGIENLDYNSRFTVEKAIFHLMTEPMGDASRRLEGGLWQLRIPDTPLRLTYEIDEDAQRIRVHHLMSENTKE